MKRPTRKQIWRKRIIRAALCLLLGAITTVAAAWASALAMPATWGDYAHDWMAIAIGGGQQWAVMRGDTPLHTRICINYRRVSPEAAIIAQPPSGQHLAHAAQETASVLPRQNLRGTPLWTALHADWVPVASTDEQHPEHNRQVETWATGWPSRSLYYTLAITGTINQEGKWQQVRSEWIGLFYFKEKRLPYRLVWPGFLLDTISYAATWWLILITPAAIRRWRRHRRGRCIHCGYDLAGLEAGATCPECGQGAGTKARSHEGTKEEA